MAVSCVPAAGGWRVSALEARGWSTPDGGFDRLADTPPYFLPDAAGFVLVLCRWSTPGEISVSLPPDATPEEQTLIRAALTAWEQAELGVRFTQAPHGAAELEIEFRETVSGSGDTAADCGIPTVEAGSALRRVEAELAYASIHLRRDRVDPLGRRIALSPAELVGATLHEIGHALGYPGHAAFGPSIMVRQVETVRDWGRRVLEGEVFESPTLSALYAFPSGVVVGHLAVDPPLLRELERVARAASRNAWRGPFVRVGDQSARLFWRGPARSQQESDRAMLVVTDWAAVLSEPARLAELAQLRMSPAMARWVQ